MNSKITHPLRPSPPATPPLNGVSDIESIIEETASEESGFSDSEETASEKSEFSDSHTENDSEGQSVESNSAESEYEDAPSDLSLSSHGQEPEAHDFDLGYEICTNLECLDRVYPGDNGVCAFCGHELED